MKLSNTNPKFEYKKYSLKIIIQYLLKKNTYLD